MTSHSQRQATSPRVLVVSQRNANDQVANAPLYEFEDLLATLDDVDLIASGQSVIMAGRQYKLARRCGASRQLARRLALRPAVPPPSGHYQLLLAVLDQYRQVATIHTIQHWRRHCDKAICFLAEIWPKDLHGANSILELFDVFDHVLVGMEHAPELLAKLSGASCGTLHLGVDALRLAPRPGASRCIDVCCIGRRSAVTHQKLLALAEQDHLLYYYDTVKGPLRLEDHREHRALFANIVNRSRYFIANYSKVDSPNITGGMQEVGSRFFEGAAGGTVILGQAPANDVFKRLFPWPDAIVDVPFDAPDIADRIRELDRDPERTARIRTANVANTLRRHDWLHRYEKMLGVAGLEASAAMAERRERLEALADEVEQGALLARPAAQCSPEATV